MNASSYAPQSSRQEDFGMELAKQFELECNAIYIPLLHFDTNVGTHGRHNVIQLTFALDGDAFSRIISNYVSNYEHGLIQHIITLTRDNFNEDPSALQLYHCSSSAFLYNGEEIEPSFDKPLVGEDTRAPDIIDILQACVDQKTANPIVHIE